MAKLFFFLEILSLSFALTTLLVDSQSQSDFISIDCGASENYTDTETGINYTSDIGYIETGESKNISLRFSTQNIAQQYKNVRSFPEGEKNCYKLTPSMGKNSRYLIRASFVYGNYDGIGQSPEFDLYLGVNKWKTVTLVNNTIAPTTMEIIHVLQSDYIHVCLVKTGSSTPFISVLEMRLLGDKTYVSRSGSLELLTRLDCGLKSGRTVRFAEDKLDRIWTPINFDAWDVINTTFLVRPNSYEPPSLVMSTAVTPRSGNNSIGFTLTVPRTNNEIPELYMYLHFSEVKDLGSNQNREFNIYLNGSLWYGPLSPTYLSASTIFSPTAIRGSKLKVLINQTENSTLPPLLNAFEIYSVKNLLSSETNKIDVDAIMNIKSTYTITRDWQGDPCEPSAYRWEGLDCHYNASDPPRILSLNLSSSRLTGVIDPHISNLTMLEKLDLSHNDLSGDVPDFLAQMSSLKFLYLEGNNFSGTIPQALLEKSKNGLIVLRWEDNLRLCSTTPCKKNNKKIIITVVLSVGGFLLLLLTSGSIFLLLRKRKQSDTIVAAEYSVPNDLKGGDELEQPKQQFSYSEILSITNNFERIIGKGGFGTVYEGNFDDGRVVAVKMLSRSSAQSFKRFNAEAKLITRVHHKNLTTVVGYCDEGPNMGIVYEYMSNGTLAFHLTYQNRIALTWGERLKIAIDASQGLEYLHSSCKPPIIHRDVKSTNILLNEKFQAKLSDFGLSRVFSLEDDSHVLTTAVGTPGYVDPQYIVTNMLTEKSDVYSFGVVLLELITGRPATSKTNGKDHVIKLVNNFRLTGDYGDVKSIMDPRPEQDFNWDSVWRVIEIAMACVAIDSAKRPTMSQVVLELRQCLEILELELKRNDNNNSVVIGSTELDGVLGTNPAPGLFSR